MEPVNLGQLRSTGQVCGTKVRLGLLGGEIREGAVVSDWGGRLPGVGGVTALRETVRGLVDGRGGRQLVWALGAHVIKVGLSEVLTGLMERGVITALVMTGAGAIHDIEMGLVGRTSEDVDGGLWEGSFGTGSLVPEVMAWAARGVWESSCAGRGLGWLLGREMSSRKLLGPSLLAKAYALGIPCCVMVAIGTDTIYMHEVTDAGSLAQGSHDDFRILCGLVNDLSGGVYVNVGSAVVLPECFLKALAFSINTTGGPKDFTVVNMDKESHYRTGENVLRRPCLTGRGKAYELIGMHEIMVPLLAQLVVDALAGSPDPAGGGG